MPRTFTTGCIATRDIRDGNLVTFRYGDDGESIPPRSAELAGPSNRVSAITIFSAGHDPGYVLRHSGEIGALLDSTVPPLGIFVDRRFSSGQVVPLEHGDTIVLLTDGITESTNSEGNLFGPEGALDFIILQRKRNAGSIVRGLYLAARTFAGEVSQFDDIASVICKVE